MSVIAFINQKGGCAKSTTAVHMAYWLTTKNHKVTVVDADAQGSSSVWLGSMEIDQIKVVVLRTPDELLEQIPGLAEQTDYLIVDGPAGLAEPTRAILFRSDLAIVPCQPTGLDLQSARDAIRLINQAKSVRGGLPLAALFISRAVKGTKLKDEAQTLLAKAQDIKVLKAVIHQKQAVADTFGQSATAWQLPGRPASESAKEYERLFKELMGML